MNTQIQQLKDKQFFLPGFVDTHTHGPQHYFTGTGYELTLLDWLERYVFPTESRFDDLTFAEKVYNTAVNETIRGGTTTCCYFATVHKGIYKVLHCISIHVQLGSRCN